MHIPGVDALGVSALQDAPPDPAAIVQAAPIVAQEQAPVSVAEDVTEQGLHAAAEAVEFGGAEIERERRPTPAHAPHADIVTPRSIDLPDGGIFTLNEVRLADRTRAGDRVGRWLLQIELEKLIWGGETTNGAVYKLLQRCSLLGTVLPIDRKAVSAGTILADEYRQVMALLPSQARKVSLIPVPCAITALKSLGDGRRVRAVLVALSEPLPRAWQLRYSTLRSTAVPLCLLTP